MSFDDVLDLSQPRRLYFIFYKNCSGSLSCGFLSYASAGTTAVPGIIYIMRYRVCLSIHLWRTFMEDCGKNLIVLCRIPEVSDEGF